MAAPDPAQRFQRIALPHLDAAYNLAYWLTRSPHDAEDLVQESFIKALRHFDGFRGEDGRAWLLAIVRNTCYSWLQARRQHPEDSLDADDSIELRAAGHDPEQALIKLRDKQLLDAAIQSLPPAFREVLVLRELEDFSYQEIAAIVGIPIGTVMSRLARARVLLSRLLAEPLGQEYPQ